MGWNPGHLEWAPWRLQGRGLVGASGTIVHDDHANITMMVRSLHEYQEWK